MDFSYIIITIAGLCLFEIILLSFLDNGSCGDYGEVGAFFLYGFRLKTTIGHIKSELLRIFEFIGLDKGCLAIYLNVSFNSDITTRKHLI
jgi:hypothetical protein